MCLTTTNFKTQKKKKKKKKKNSSFQTVFPNSGTSHLLFLPDTAAASSSSPPSQPPSGPAPWIEHPNRARGFRCSVLAALLDLSLSPSPFLAPFILIRWTGWPLATTRSDRRPNKTCGDSQWEIRRSCGTPISIVVCHPSLPREPVAPPGAPPPRKPSPESHRTVA
ncbi:hypothetical protein TIFTF001_006585 [Ficus carica]|uniref:Uncharacterized protein n=1 Tax=Ficus carica TaxID=3494 RepID=A0AA88D0Y2_FICCA|nr:hypothetical protein TIFTF001_006585 [Ficus carica]